jgi:hypothetical protein
MEMRERVVSWIWAADAVLVVLLVLMVVLWLGTAFNIKIITKIVESAKKEKAVSRVRVFYCPLCLNMMNSQQWTQLRFVQPCPRCERMTTNEYQQADMRQMAASSLKLSRALDEMTIAGYDSSWWKEAESVDNYGVG